MCLWLSFASGNTSELTVPQVCTVSLRLLLLVPNLDNGNIDLEEMKALVG